MEAPKTHSERPANTAPKKRPPTIRMIYRKPGALLATLIIIVLGGFAGWYFFVPHGQRIDTSGYQIVYLSTGQTYFGKLKNTNGNYLVLEHPYTAQNVAQAVDSKTAPDAAEQTTLVKLRDQVYGPEDSIALRADQVLFWQNLRDDSKVVTAIKTKQ